MWQMYGDLGLISEDWYTEEEVRQFLSEANSSDIPTVITTLRRSLYTHAQNAAGDIIESHDGPVTIARPKL